MNLLQKLPPTQEGQILAKSEYSGFAFSLQGVSHEKASPPAPCQDYSDIRYLEEAKIVLAAIADGVGSCSLSHWGAYTAVCAALDSAQQALKKLSDGKPIVLDDCGNGQMKTILVAAFTKAVESVEMLADEAQQLPFNFQSTLTLAIYDGKDLFFGHAGDDGIVVQTKDGNVEMLTARQKGDEAGSVYPLQSGEKVWHFGRAAKPVAAFLMATDGVLDAFVENRPDYYGVNYNGGICYAFMEDAVYTLGENVENAPQKALKAYLEYLKSPQYREMVTDDLTLVAVVYRPLLTESVRPKFSMEIWKCIQRESSLARKNLLNRKPIPGAGPMEVISTGRQKKELPMRNSPEKTQPLAPKGQSPARKAQAPASRNFQMEPTLRKKKKSPKRSLARLLTVLLLIILMIGAVASLLYGKGLMPSILPEKSWNPWKQREELAQRAESLAVDNLELTQTNQELEEKLSLVMMELKQANEQIQNLESQIEVLNRQINAFQSTAEVLEQQQNESGRQ